MPTLLERLKGGDNPVLTQKYRERANRPDSEEWRLRHHLPPLDEISEFVAWQATVPNIVRSSPPTSARPPQLPAKKSIGVGTALHKILSNLGIKPPCVSCGTFMSTMNSWGIEGCRVAHRQEIIDHLNAEASKASWLDWAKVLLAGYASSEALLDEAIKRTEEPPC